MKRIDSHKKHIKAYIKRINSHKFHKFTTKNTIFAGTLSTRKWSPTRNGICHSFAKYVHHGSATPKKHMFYIPFNGKFEVPGAIGAIRGQMDDL